MKDLGESSTNVLAVRIEYCGETTIHLSACYINIDLENTKKKH